MRLPLAAPLLVLLGACGGDDDNGGGPADAPPSAPPTITISGEATKRAGATESIAAGATVAAYKNSDPNTPVAMTTTDAAGMYSLTIETGGVALDGYVKATLATFLDLYLYPPAPLTADFAGASLNIVNQTSVDLIGTLCAGGQQSTNGIIAVLVVDSARAPIAAAKVTTSPAARKYCYNGDSDLPMGAATETKADGIAYILDVKAGDVTVSATAGGSTFGAHEVNARAGAFTTTVVQR